MRRLSGRGPAVATGSATDWFAVAVATVTADVAIERPGRSGMWNEGEQAAGSRRKCKYLRGVTDLCATHKLRIDGRGHP